jgi:hypothetical protein
MALAYVLNRAANDPDIQLTNYGEFLELHPPEWEVEIHEKTSWSCEHGVERWRSNCGCNMGHGWQQQWREPLREALDDLKAKLDDLFTREGRTYFHDPWSARDDFIRVILNRDPEFVEQFLHVHQPSSQLGDRLGACHALWLLEMQRHAMLMYTSCGWFFDELSGLETTQCLRYAARAIQLARHFQGDFEGEFVQRLEKAPSNLPEFENGRGVWEQAICPGRIDLDRVLAHFAISLIYGERQQQTRVYCYDVDTLDQEVHGRGNTHIAIGRLRVRSRLTWNDAETCFLVVHFGGLDFHAALRKALTPEEYQTFKDKLVNLYESDSLADVAGVAVQEFQGDVHRLTDLFVEEQRRIVGIVLKDRFADYQQSFEKLADADDDLLMQLGRLRYPIPRPMRAAATVRFDQGMLEEISQLDDEEALKRIKQLLKRGRGWGYEPNRELLGPELRRELKHVLAGIQSSEGIEKTGKHVGNLLDAASLLGVNIELWQAQNQLLDSYASLQKSASDNQSLREAFGLLANRLRVHVELLGWQP